MIYLFLFLLIVFWALNFFSLPGNWLVLISLGIFDYFNASFSASLMWWLGLVFLALSGEILEWLGQYWGGKKYGLSGKGNVGAIIGAIGGAILGAPFFLGLGAIIGGLLGAYLGGLFTERLSGKSWDESLLAAKGAVLGKFLGLLVKLSLGMAILALAFPRLLALS
ncbi:MAG: uncharacterized protein PWR24_87 [Desulfonauticus sp.]|jgi:hypothetical protein|nr:MAG: hypothetical protein XD41_0498 [Desulfonauticus sp. 38_4375]MDK2920530.1 uncharacterized protein [Desulfonauticus sp.]